MRRSSQNAADQPAELLDLAVIESPGRLVEQQELRMRRERARELDALLHAERQVGDATPRHLAQIEEINELGGDLGEPALDAPGPRQA